MILSEIKKILDKAFPPSLAYEWDNVGLLVGDEKKDIKKILLTLDVTEYTVSEAISCGADLILSHHPVLFSAIKRITAETAEERALIAAIKNDICIFAAHTNCDTAPFGINAYLAQLFDLVEPEPIEDTGLGRIGNLKEETTLAAFAQTAAKKLNTPHVRVSGDLEATVKRVAIGSGACSDSIPKAAEMGADVMLTSDMKYHEAINAVQQGIYVIDAGHYPTEVVALDIFEKLLSGCNVQIFRSHNPDIFKYI